MTVEAAVKKRLGDFLNLELYAIETRWERPVEEVQKYAQAHLDHQVALERSGVLFAAGPLFEQDSPRFPPSAGLIVVRASSFEEADVIARSDPMHKAGVRNYTIRRWIVNEGSFPITVRLSDQTVVIQ